MPKRKATAPIKDTRPKKKKAGSERFKGTKLFVTYPQNETTKETLIERILEKYPNEVEWIVASNEDHEPTELDKYAGMHSHVIFKVKKQRWFTHKLLDYIGGKRGNYQCMKGKFYQAAEYVIKHGDWTTYNIRDLAQRIEQDTGMSK